MKHGSGSEEHLHGTSSISPCSPGLPQLWDIPMANKGGHVHPNSYMNSFDRWYPNQPPQQDAMSRPQMWVPYLRSHSDPHRLALSPQPRHWLWCHLNTGLRLTEQWAFFGAVNPAAITFYPALFCAWLNFIAKLISGWIGPTFPNKRLQVWRRLFCFGVFFCTWRHVKGQTGRCVFWFIKQVLLETETLLWQ